MRFEEYNELKEKYVQRIENEMVYTKPIGGHVHILNSKAGSSYDRFLKALKEEIGDKADGFANMLIDESVGKVGFKSN